MTRKHITHSKYPFAAMARINSIQKKGLINPLAPKSVEQIDNSEFMEICSVVYNQPEFVSMLHESLKNTCTNPWRLHIIDNGSDKKYADTTRSACSADNIKYHSRECIFPPSRASQAHGDALNYAVAKIGSEHSLMMLVDSDINFVKKGWDKLIRNSLPILGHVTTVRNQDMVLPAAFLSVFRKRSVLNKKISFMPEIRKNGKAIYGKDVGHRLSMIPANRWKKLGNNIINGSDGLITNIGGSYEISIDNIMIASHLSRGRFSKRRRDSLRDWISQCGTYLLNNS